MFLRNSDKRFKTNVKPLLQFSDTECGIAALAMVLDYYQVKIPLEQLREKCGTSRDGCKALTLLEVARELGFSADGYKVELENIIKLGKPVIAFWNFNHYVVITGASRKTVYLNDPAQGSMAVSVAEFDDAFTGIVLAITPTEQVKKQYNKQPAIKYLEEWIKPFKWELVFIFVLSMLYMTIPLLNSAITSIFINYTVIGKDKHWLPWLSGFAGVLALLMILIRNAQHHYQFNLAAKASLFKSRELISHSLKLPLLYFSLRQKSEIITILARAESVINSYITNLTGFFLNIFMIIMCLAAMVVINLFLTLKIIILIMLCTIIPITLSKYNYQSEKKSLNSESKLYATNLANCRNLPTIKSCALEVEILKKWCHVFHKNLQNRNDLYTTATKIASINQSIQLLCVVAMLYWGWLSLLQGSCSLGNLLAFYALLLLAAKNMEALLLACKSGQKAYAAHLRINDLKKYDIDKRFDNLTESPATSKPLSISCQNLYFYYNLRDVATLKQINLTIMPGKQIALVGATGSGKSTLAKLFCGLYPSTQGEIFSGSNNIKEFSPADFARQFSYVAQDINLFSGTIYENLTLGLLDVSLPKIINTIQQTCLQNLIEQHGLHGRVEENGSNFSGGERQRLEIARALLRDAPVLILDEATSALDVATEAIIMANLRSLSKTIIYVAHRLSTIRHCDHIYVLQHGSIVEQGNHEQLLKKENHYYQLVHEEKITSEC